MGEAFIFQNFVKSQGKFVLHALYSPYILTTRWVIVFWQKEKWGLPTFRRNDIATTL
jgi:hypothetical protein